MNNVINKLNQTGYSHELCMSIRFAFTVYPETVQEFKELLDGIADVEVFSKGKKQILLITPKDKP